MLYMVLFFLASPCIFNITCLLQSMAMAETSGCSRSPGYTARPHSPASLVVRCGLMTGSSPWTIHGSDEWHYHVWPITTVCGILVFPFLSSSCLEWTSAPRKALNLLVENGGASFSLCYWMTVQKRGTLNPHQIHLPSTVTWARSERHFFLTDSTFWMRAAGISLTDTTVPSFRAGSTALNTHHY